MSRPERRGVGLTAVRVGLALVAASAGLVALVLPSPGPPARPAPLSPAPVTADVAAPVTAAAPTRLRIPSLGIDSPLARLGVDAAGALVPPEDFGQAGWFADGIVPGEVGPAVVAGHVDSRTGPAVFFRLADLAAGDDVLVERGNGTTAHFVVTHVDRYAKDAFPTEEVYGPTQDAQLRLITCGGDFDRSARSYVDNVVVFARLTGRS